MQELFVDTPEQLNALCEQLRGSPWLALDTEFVREKTYHPNFCLLQVANGEVAACVDPLVLDDITPLLDIIFDSGITKVFHAARQDLEIFQHLWQRLPVPLFDTQLAATLLGMGDQVGYGNLVKKTLGLELEKGHARTDWARRPLQETQLRYALDDVIYLGEVYEQLLQRLLELGRESWLDEDFATLSNPDTYRPDPMSEWQRIKGRQHLKGGQLAVLQQLAAWREKQALEANRPKRWILKDEVLVDLARRQPKALDQMERIRGLEPGSTKRHGKHLLQLIEKGKGLPRDEWPKEKSTPPRLTPNQEAQTDLLVCTLRLQAEQNRITHSALANRRELEKLVTGERDLDILHGWRKMLAGDALLEVLEGKTLPRYIDGKLTLASTRE
ncbi:MAG: ribonuclease D [Candidatus Sedimenticola sp. 6PFRAG1]